MAIDNKDPSGVIQFSPGLTELMIWESCLAYYQLSGEQLALTRLFNAWFSVNHPHLFELSSEQESLFNQSKLEIAGKGKQEYFRSYLPAFESEAL